MAVEIVALSDELRALDRYNEDEVSISIHRLDSRVFAAAIAQADNHGDRWWVSRVLVRNPDKRGQGLGSIALQRMLAVIAGLSRLPVYVAPGGYEDNTEQQFRFYLKNGFQRIENDSKNLVWNPPGPIA